MAVDSFEPTSLQEDHGTLVVHSNSMAESSPAAAAAAAAATPARTATASDNERRITRVNPGKPRKKTKKT